MKNIIIYLSVVFFIPVRWTFICKTQGFEEGLAAYEIDEKAGYEIAFKEFMEAAEKGHAVAQSYLGIMYTKGQGVRKDYKKAFKWVKKAAEQGHVTATEQPRCDVYQRSRCSQRLQRSFQVGQKRL